MLQDICEISKLIIHTERHIGKIISVEKILFPKNIHLFLELKQHLTLLCK